MKVVGYTPNATEAVHRENSFNEKAGPGEQYVLVALRTTYEGTGECRSMERSGVVRCVDGWNAHGGGWRSLAQRSRPGRPGPLRGQRRGNVGFLVRSSDVPGLTLYIEADTPDFETEGAFFALS